MIRFIICEDNTNFLNKIADVVQKIMLPTKFDYKIHKFNEYNENLEKIIENTTDEKIYILDVEMPRISGLEIASQIREEDEESIIIFLTCHPECKSDVFYSRLLALDYIQKGQLWDDRLKDTLLYITKKLERKRTIDFKYQGSLFRIPYEEVNYIEKIQDLKKCIIYTIDDKEYEFPNNIAYLERTLGPSFYKCHKSIMVNVENIKHINYQDNTIIFKNNESAYIISNRQKKGLREYVRKY